VDRIHARAWERRKRTPAVGAVLATPAVVNAILDALAPFGVKHLDMPITPRKIWAAMQSGL